jgi:hypothetical protein
MPNQALETLATSRNEDLPKLLEIIELRPDIVFADDGGRPHSSLGPGLPELLSDQVPPNDHRHKAASRISDCEEIRLGGLHHEYGAVKEAAWRRISIFANYRGSKPVWPRTLRRLSHP